MEDNPGWFAHPFYEKWAEPFEDKYQMVDMVMVGDNTFAKNKTKKKEFRHCTFCDKSHPYTKFNNDAHLLSKIIGNTNLFSTFECDSCNNKFSLFETDLASFLGLGRSITSLSNNKKAPGFPGIGLEARSIIFKDKKLMVIHKENAERNVEEGSTKLDYQKPTYTPANIYKLFLKCALSVLPQNEVIRDYKLALLYLQGGQVLTGSHINVFRFPLTVKMPLHVYIFKKKIPSDKIPTYIMSFYFDNMVVSFPVLLHCDDLIYLNETVQIPAPPPYFIHGNDLTPIVPTFTRYDLSSPLKLKFEPEEITMQFNKDDLDNATMFDTKTGELKQTVYNPAGSKYFIATEHGTVFSKEELPELMERIEQEFSI